MTAAVAAVDPIVTVTVCAVLLANAADVAGTEQVGVSEPVPPLTAQVSVTCPMNPPAGVMVTVPVPGAPGLTVIAPLFDSAKVAPDGSETTHTFA